MQVYFSDINDFTVTVNYNFSLNIEDYSLSGRINIFFNNWLK